MSLLARHPNECDVWSAKLPVWMATHGADHLLEETTVTVDGAEWIHRPGGMYSPGFDHARMFSHDKQQHSTGFVFCRCEDTPTCDRSKGANWWLWQLHCGPRHVEKNVDILFRPIVKEFERLRGGMHDLEDAVLGQVSHYPYMGPVYVDSKAREALLKTTPAGSAMPDYRSKWVSGEREEDSNFTYAKGYAVPVMQPRAVWDQHEGRHVPTEMFANDPRLDLTHGYASQLATLVEEKKVDYKAAGRHGHSPFKDLTYFHYVYHVPIAWVHGALWGMVKHFWRDLIGSRPGNNVDNVPGFTVTPEVLKVWIARGAGLSVPTDHGRGYSCIVDCAGQWVMEDWLNWTLFYSDIVLGGTLAETRPQVHKAWLALQSAIFYHMRPSVVAGNGDMVSRADARKQARASLWQFAEIMELHGPRKAMSMVLRLVVVHSYQQEEWTGAIVHSNEFWVERAIHFMKLLMNGYTGSPEVMLGNAYEWMTLMMDVFAEECATIDARSTKEPKGMFDTEGMTHNCKFVGPATLRDRKRIRVKGAANTYVDDYTADAEGVFAKLPNGEEMRRLVHSYLQDMGELPTEVCVFARAEVRGEIVHSMDYRRGRSRISTSVCVAGIDRGDEYGNVIHFFRVKSNTQWHRLCAVQTRPVEDDAQRMEDRGMIATANVTPLVELAGPVRVIAIADIERKVVLHSPAAASKLHAIHLWHKIETTL